MKPLPHRWVNLNGDGSLRVFKYSFGPGTANTFAVLLDDGSFLVVSPSANTPASVWDELARTGPVSLLLAPNAYHHRGQAAWRARFPDARSYAPEGARARLVQKSPDVSYRPLSELAAKLPARVAVIEPDGFKSPDLLLRVTSGADTAYWLGDLFSNSTKDDQIWPLRLLAHFAGSGLGYRRNTKPELVYVRDRVAWLDSVRRALALPQPTVVVPAHGDPILEDTARRTAAVLE
jgi:glyoxylase-like metal-dependent hydrolase (beta-lactamase superfamily II)